MEIQWYPGHMAKTKRLIKEGISLVDVVIELLDARIPISSRNPDIDELTKGKKRVIVFNKWDLSDELKSNQWRQIYEDMGHAVVFANCVTGKGVDDIEKTVRLLVKEKIEAQNARGRLTVPIRAMAIGIPNVGKSTLINRYAKKNIAKAEDRPGVTRNKQWIKVKKDFEILDTPGILWHKFDDKNIGLNIAFTGGIKDNIIDIVTLASELLRVILFFYPENISARYGVNVSGEDLPVNVLERIGQARGHLVKGGEIDIERTAVMLVDEFRAGKIGRMTLDNPGDFIQPVPKP